jgi:hypothetical protein
VAIQGVNLHSVYIDNYGEAWYVCSKTRCCVTSMQNWQARKQMHSTDTAIDGSGFSVYSIYIEAGAMQDQPGLSFVVAGRSTLPKIDDLWNAFLQKQIGHLTGQDINRFLDFVKYAGYVQIEQTVTIGLSY